jgi:hypothetical protein
MVGIKLCNTEPMITRIAIGELPSNTRDISFRKVFLLKVRHNLTVVSDKVKYRLFKLLKPCIHDRGRVKFQFALITQPNHLRFNYITLASKCNVSD